MNKLIIIALIFLPISLFARILSVGNNGDGYDYSTISHAATDAIPGDTIMLFDTKYDGGEYIVELHGSEDMWINILPNSRNKATFEGGNQAIHFVNVSYVRIFNLGFQYQEVNGVNIDDGGDYAIPTHHIIFEECSFGSIQAEGNNDLLKMSGVDYFEIKNCDFRFGSPGGSMIDMVGCHNGIIENNIFEEGGSNSIQAKGGTEYLEIRRNRFINGGARAINIGGSTGMQYFRPLGANFESARINIYSNIFENSQAPIAFVGTVESNVFNNTIILPSKWAIRILQENTNEGMLACGNNSFYNNIVYLGNAAANPTMNIGPNTAPDTFTFSNNLWYNSENSNWGGPNLPVEEVEEIIGEDPLFINFASQNYKLQVLSPAKAQGKPLDGAFYDYSYLKYNNPPSIGAFEWDDGTIVYENSYHNSDNIYLFPQPADYYLNIYFNISSSSNVNIKLLNLAGNTIKEKDFGINLAGDYCFEISSLIEYLPTGLYFVIVQTDNNSSTNRLIVIK